MKHFLTTTGLFFTLLLNKARLFFVQKACNSLIITPPPSTIFFSGKYRKISHGTYAGRTNCRSLSVFTYGYMVFVQNKLEH
jgi:hypothetical protein